MVDNSGRIGVVVVVVVVGGGVVVVPVPVPPLVVVVVVPPVPLVVDVLFSLPGPSTERVRIKFHCEPEVEGMIMARPTSAATLQPSALNPMNPSFIPNPPAPGWLSVRLEGLS
jgi:hypothetical protein